MQMEIVGFLEGKTPDHRGRMLAMIMKQTDHQAEATHDYIQWLFPLDEPSRSVMGVPVPNELDIEEILINNRCVEEARLWDLGLRLLFLSPAMLTNTTQ